VFLQPRGEIIISLNSGRSGTCSVIARIHSEHKFFPDNKYLLQENYVEYQKEHMLKCINVL